MQMFTKKGCPSGSYKILLGGPGFGIEYIIYKLRCSYAEISKVGFSLSNIFSCSGFYLLHIYCIIISRVNNFGVNYNE